MSDSKSRPRSSLLPIFMTVFIDMLGVGIIIPVIPALFFEETSGFFSAGTETATRSILYGFLVASYPIMQFFGAPLLGSLSDRHGRKPLITVSLFGTMIGYLLFAVAILRQDILLLFISRMIPGFTGGNISIIYSAISDVSTADARTRNFGLIGMAFGLGFILGPTLGGILADETVVSWFNPTTPFWFTAALTLANIILVRFRFRETIKERRHTKLGVFSGVRNIGKSFRRSHLRTIFSVVLLLSLGFSFFTQFFSVRLIEKFDYTEANIGILYGWIGIWLVVTQGLIVRYLSRKVASRKILQFSIIALSLTLGLILLPQDGGAFWFYIINPFVAMSQGVTTPNLTSVVSEQASATEQGEILGINQSMNSIGQAVPPIIAGYLYTLNSNLPLISAAGLTLVAWLVYMLIFRRKKSVE